jgi:hypothetical protein
VRIIHAKNPHSEIAPESDYIVQLLPQGLPVRIVKIQRINILVFLWRILGVFDRSIRALKEPLGMIANVRMIGRAIDGEVQRDLHSPLLDLANQPLEILERSKFRRHILMATAVDALTIVADGIGNTRLTRLTCHRVVASFARCLANGMDRRKVYYVKTHRLGIIDPWKAIAKSRPAVGPAFGGTREEFVPRSVYRELLVHPKWQ